MEFGMKTTIYVFQISDQSDEGIQHIKGEINLIPGIKHWNFDLSDPDFKIFRVEASKNISREVTTLFTRFHFHCYELMPDRK
jgi:hypothetical protein